MWQQKNPHRQVNRLNYAINVLYLYGLLARRCGYLPGVNKIRTINHKLCQMLVISYRSIAPESGWSKGRSIGASHPAAHRYFIPAVDDHPSELLTLKPQSSPGLATIWTSDFMWILDTPVLLTCQKTIRDEMVFLAGDLQKCSHFLRDSYPENRKSSPIIFLSTPLLLSP